MQVQRAVVFDLDDSLFLESDFVLSGFHAVASWLQIHGHVSCERTYGHLLQLHRAGVRANTFDHLLGAFGLNDRIDVKDLVEVYRRHTPAIGACEDAIAVVPDLRSVYRIGLVSDGFLEVQRNKLDALGIREWFDAVVFSDELGRDNWKPSCRPFQEVLLRLDVVAANAVYVGDNPSKDFLGARRTGMKSIRLRRDGGIYARTEPETAEHAPDDEIDDLFGLETAIRKLLDSPE